MDFAVIMAGGTGQRLWPLSRQSRPKQILKLLDGRTLLRECFDRLTKIFDLRNILVLTNAQYMDQVCENLSELPEENIIAEPCVRDTSGAIGLAAAILTRVDPQATMAVVTADHVLEPHEPFIEVMKTALMYVSKHPQALLTFGIKPTFAATQYGYIRLGEPKENGGKVLPVTDFREKPDQPTAERYLADGGYYWNSGMFVWKAGTILKLLKTHLPACSEPLDKIHYAWGGPDQESTLREWFPQLPKISIDFAVMEKAADVYGIPLNCRWLDLGSFAALADIISSDGQHNIVVAGHSQLLDCRNTIVATEDAGHLIAMIGVEDMIVAHSPDATLICPVSQSHRMKELLAILEKRGKGKFL